VTAIQHWRDTLGEALLIARKGRDSTRVSALRSALSAIDNAGAVHAAPQTTGGTIASAVVGLGAAEVARRDLSDTEIRELLRAEIDERLSVAGRIEASHPERSASLHAEAAALTALLGDV
jgi:hypothetical protein